MTAAGRPDHLLIDFQAALIGRYSLERELGRGGMGIVYLASELRLDRWVAIKLLPPTAAGDPGLRERFLREARTAARLSHPHIIPIFTVDEVGPFVFFAMAYVQGETLAERVRRGGPLTPPEAARVLREAAWALAYAHSQGLVHRDVKPDNILLEEATGRALVADFGIAAEVHEAGPDGAELIGTPEFMSPEQALGEPVDARSDLYALGAVGYFALTGKLPFEGANATTILAKQATEPAPPVGSVVAVPRRLAQAIDSCLAKDPAERPQSGEVLAEQLGVAIGQRREMPVALQVFVRRGARLSGVGWLVYLGLVPVATALVGQALDRGAAVGLLLAALTAVPFAVLVNRARRLLASGFGYEDVKDAFRVELERGREERSVEFGRGPSIEEWIFRTLCISGLAVAAVSGFRLLTATYPAMTFTRWQWLVQVLRWSSLGGVVSGFLAVERLQRRTDLDTRIWSWCWQGPLGRLLFRIARSLAPARAGAPPTHRATALALALAAEQLFLDLPRQLRSELKGLPDVVRRLEGDAQQLRHRLDELQEALGGPDRGGESVDARHDRVVADLEAERSALSHRQAQVVKALATLRLNLLRLHAGTGTVQGLTTDLSRAREVADEIYRQIAARQEVDDALL